MLFSQKITRILGRSTNTLTHYAVSGLCPTTFWRSLHYHAGIQAPDWQGRKACFTLSFDVDYREDVLALPELIELLSEYEITASFAIIGKWVQDYPAEHKLIVEHGHEIINHTFSHPDNEQLSPGRFFDLLSDQEKQREITEADSAIREILGITPAGFRAPHFGNIKMDTVYGLLAQTGYTYSTSVTAPGCMKFGLPWEVARGIWEFPVTTCPGHPFSSFDTWHSLRKPGTWRKHGAWHKNGDNFFRVFKDVLRHAMSFGSYVNLYFDPRDIAGHGQSRRLLEHAAGLADELWMLPYGDLLNHLQSAAKETRGSND